ncbi:MAG: MFS transporter, partial [Pseudomonadota bacterium]|nr:MFS transporter [Pseudomonadota bacterium]
AALFAPSLAVSFGWNNVLGLITIPLSVGLVIYMVMAKDSPYDKGLRPKSSLLSLLKEKDAWLLMFFYSITFGGFVGLASSLTIYFHDQYAISAVSAGLYTALCVFFGSLVRPLGGWMADRIGGVKTLSIMLGVVVCLMLFLGKGPANVHLAVVILVPAMLALGMGNGAVFQLVPQRFGRDIGVMTGVVGMAGGLGGFVLAAGLGYVKQLTDGYSGGFLGFAILAIMAFLLLQGVRTRWQNKWGLVEVMAQSEV